MSREQTPPNSAEETSCVVTHVLKDIYLLPILSIASVCARAFWIDCYIAVFFGLQHSRNDAGQDKREAARERLFETPNPKFVHQRLVV